MHRTVGRLFSVIGALLLGACATLPKNTRINYYLTTTDLQFTVVRTVGCSADNHIVVASTVMATPIHRADLTAQQSFDLSSQSSQFADGDVRKGQSEGIEVQASP